MTEFQTSKEYDPQDLDHNVSSLPPKGQRGARVPDVLLEGNPMKELGGGDATLSSRVAIAIDPVALITTECITVTSAMRKHARWAHSSVSAILGGSSISYRTGPLSASSDRAQWSPVKAPSTGTQRGIEGSTANDEGNLTGRWGLRGRKAKSMQDNPLMSAFARLRGELRGCEDIRSFDIPSLLHPFLQVIRSSSTSAPITSLALIAITKFFAYSLVSRSSPRLSVGMQLLSAAITHCRFEASDSAADEIVLLRILKLMEVMLSGPGGNLLGDESVCEMMETGLSMCCQMRLSELLRRSAEVSMITMCQILFERLKHLEDEAGGDGAALEATAHDADGGELKMDAPLTGTNAASPQRSTINAPLSPNLEAGGNTQQAVLEARRSASFEQQMESNDLSMINAVNGSAINLTQIPSLDTQDVMDIRPYSLPSIRELFRVLVNLLEPHDRQHTDTMRIMALRIIDVALEVAGPSIAKHSSLASLAKDHLCRNLFQLVRSDNINLLNESLRVAGTLLATCRGMLKLQQELFLSYLVACLHPRVEIPRESGIDPSLYEGVPYMPKLVKQPPSSTSSGRSTPVPVKDRQKLGMEGGSRKPDAREAMVESVGALTRIPSFLAELFVNYDCEVDRSDLCEDLVGLLSRNALPDSATWSTTNVPPLCLDALLSYIQFMADRLDDEPFSEGYPDPKKLRRQRYRKKIIIKGVNKFNESPKGGIAYLASQGIIENPNDPQSVAQFLKGTTRISKKVLGEYISKLANEPLLRAFLDFFDFTDKRVDEALRDLLGAFRLPGESALIERIVTVFAEKYCVNSTPQGIADKDSVFVLTYAIIMLNTDQHNPNVKTQNRMALADFAKNLRGVNGGKDFDSQYLQDIYDSIKNNEIILPDEHDNKHAFDYAWKELLLKTDTAGDLVIFDTNIFDADMFDSTWKPVVATLSYVFMSASEDAVYQRVVTGFDQCAQIAARYNVTEALDHIIYCLATITTLAPSALPNTSLNTEVQVGKKSVMVSELAVKFGRDYRAQLATVVLFRGVIASNEPKIQKGWGMVRNLKLCQVEQMLTYDKISRIWLNLFTNSLMPATFHQSHSLLEVPPIPIQSPHVVNREGRSNESGLFQSFTSYLSSYAADDPPEPSDEELRDTLCTVDCLAACPIEEIFTNILTLPPKPLAALTHALLDQIPEESSPAVIVVKPEQGSPNPRVNGQSQSLTTPSYDPSIVYILEISTMFAIRDEASTATIGQDVAEALQNIVRNAANNHSLIVSRAAFYLLSLLSASHDQPFIRAPVILHTISSLDQSVSEKAALPILKGLTSCMRGPRPLRNEIANTPDFWSIIRGLHTIPAAAGTVFDILMGIMVDKPSAITADNYEFAIEALNGFATAGSAGAVVEQKRDRTIRRSKAIKSIEPRDNELVSHAIQAVTMIWQLSSRVPALIEQSHLERKEAWTAYWSPIFRALSTQCVNPCREIRQQAFSGLQRALLSPELASADHQEWTAIFGEVLFPVILQLLRPEVYHSDPFGMSETRVQAATLLCKIFLHYLVLLSEWDGMLELWLRILEIMDRLMNSGQGDSLEEAVPESLKNILLVMANGGYLAPPSESPQYARLWEETWKRLERFLPGMFREIFPDPPQTPSVAVEQPLLEEVKRMAEDVPLEAK
ncbi:GDP/GTP exchange factor for ARF [Xylographa parallela]|nr:GDP/GTP exchange factor for ARF [Xylographa parallela]